MTLTGRRLRAQLLSGPPARDPVAVAERLLAIQAQDPRGARLAIRARSQDLAAADIDRELTERRSLLITWLNRGTLHLIRSVDFPLLHALTTPQLRTASARRLHQEGVEPNSADRAVRLLQRWLAEDGPLTRAELRDRHERAGFTVAGQAHVHIMFRAALDGVIVRGPMVGREHAYALATDWLGPELASPPAIDRDRALAELARRYVAGHGPASDADLARWAGLPLRDARAALRSIAAELRVGAGSLVELASSPARAARLPPPRLLGAFEPVLLGWCSRAEIVGEHEPRLISGGVFRGFAMARGRAVAGWRIGTRGAIALDPFAELPAAERTALSRDGEAVRAFLGLA